MSDGACHSLRLVVASALLFVGAEARPAEPSTAMQRLQRELATLEKLKQLSLEMVRSREAIEDLRHQRRLTTYEVTETERRIAALAKRLAGQRPLLRRQLRALYKLARGGWVRLLLEAGSGLARLRQTTALRRIVDRDLREVRLYRDELRALQHHRQRVEAQRQRQRLLDLRLQQAHHRRAGATRRQRELWQTLRRKRARRTGQPDGPAERALRQKIATIERALPRIGGFARLRGRLPRPVPGQLLVGPGLLTDRRTEMKVPHHGVTFSARRGTPVRSVAPGIVRFAGPLDGWGEAVIIDHGRDYRTVTAYLGKVVATGDEVTSGAEIGRVGAYPWGGAPRVYFEIRRGSVPLDPAAWLAR